MGVRKEAHVAHSGGRSLRRWLLLMPQLPAAATTPRVRIWRRLQGVGAVTLRPSVYVLPAREGCTETFQWVAREIAELGGRAALCEAEFLDAASDSEIESASFEARNGDYAALGKEATALAKALPVKHLSEKKLRAIDAQHAKLRRRLDQIVAVDFLGAPGRQPAEGVLSGIGRRLEALRGSQDVADELGLLTRPSGATWVTRAGVHVDRIACAWLIRRFVDPDARLKFAADRQYMPQPGELRYDMYEAELTHVGDRCSFEVILQRMGLADPALAALGEIIHDIDMRDDKFRRPEAAGVGSVITGICSSKRDDRARIAAATPMFEALYAYFSHASRRAKRAER